MAEKVISYGEIVHLNKYVDKKHYYKIQSEENILIKAQILSPVE